MTQSLVEPAAPVLWPLALKQTLHLPRAALGLVTFVAVLAGFAAAGAVPFDTAPSSDAIAQLGSVLFFAVSLALLVEAAPYVLAGAQRDLDAMRPVLAIDPGRFAHLRDTLARYPRRELLLALLGGIAIGLLHAQLAGHRPFTLLGAFDGVALMRSVCTVALWVLMFQLAAPLVRNAVMFATLGAHHARIDLYNTESLAAFGRAALRPTLIIIGLQAAYPLLLLGDGRIGSTTLLGLFASLALVLALFFVPLRGVRRRVAKERDAALHVIDQRLAQLWSTAPATRADVSAAELADAAGLLAIKARLQTLSTWPLGSAVLARGALYAAIPLVTWSLKLGLEVAIGAML